MTSRRRQGECVRLSRWWPASLYVLATVLAQCVHDHHGVTESATRCEASCADAQTHLSGHSARDLSHSPTDCLACQYRAEHLSWLLSPPLFLRPSATVSVVESSLLASPRQPRWV